MQKDYLAVGITIPHKPLPIKMAVYTFDKSQYKEEEVKALSENTCVILSEYDTLYVKSFKFTDNSCKHIENIVNNNVKDIFIRVFVRE